MNRTLVALATLVLLAALCLPNPVLAQSDDPTPPSQPVKLIFIHHSTGENWLTDGYGDLGRALAENNYFVSDTNYGWGPDAIGDRTDIPNWPEWFAGDRTPAYMEALYNESGQHAAYTRTQADPGGENQIVMFKSCFPNSDLEGSPTDPPDPDGWLSVGHAKYVYNQILPYFASRPDKLFIVVTAPPLSDAAHAANARAFNNWLLNDWLDENDYALDNVAVFDFYNILTAPDAHHRFAGGRIEHAAAGSNTLAYPSGDDHPSVEGSRKATDEFLSLLNIFYHRWRASAGQTAAATVRAPEAAPTAQLEAAASDQPSLNFTGTIDDFEAANTMSGEGWQAYSDEGGKTRVTCGPVQTEAHGGEQALQIDYSVAAGGWATCDLRFDQPQDWSSAEGLTFYAHTAEGSLPFNVDLYSGNSGQIASYVTDLAAPPESSGGWAPVSVPWSDFHRVDWEENAGSPLADLSSVAGLAFGFNPPDAEQEGVLWIDDLQLAGASESQAAPVEGAPAAAIQTEETPPPAAETAENGKGAGGGLCPAAMALPLAVAGLAWGRHQFPLNQSRN